MSSVDFSKCKGAGQAAARVAHMTRHDGKDDVEYANKWVDKSRTHLNTVIGASGLVDDVPSTRKTIARLKKRVREIDDVLPPKRVRKDRVTMVTLTIAAPDGLLKKDEERFFRIAYDEIAAFCGGVENCSDGFIHRDEQHEYIDTDGSKCTSRPHMHMAVVPFVEGKGINGKAFETRSRMRALNESIDQRCREELHISFMTRRRGRTGRTVEELQAMSEGKAIAEARKELDELNEALNVLKQLYTVRAGYISDITADVRPADVKEHKTLTGKVKSVEVPIDVWRATMITRQTAEDAKEYRRKLEQETDVLRKVKSLLDANDDWERSYKSLERRVDTLVGQVRELAKENADYKRAVDKVAQKYPGFAQELVQELRPAVDVLIERYNKQYEQQGGRRRRDTGWER